jgi:NAD(P)-dependent dehydrogenase (short-subunit alcohol dehydrogenase family)
MDDGDSKTNPSAKFDRRDLLKGAAVLAGGAALGSIVPDAMAAAPSALKGKVAFVTGASRGIGEGIARRFAAEGATVVCLARTLEPGTGENAGSLKEVVAGIEKAGGKAHAIQCDITDKDSRASAVAEAIKRVGHVDILVNNAAAATLGTHWYEMAPKRYYNILELNLNGPFDFMQRFIGGLRDRGEGWILNISSAGAELPKGPPFNPLEQNGLMLYGTTKAALNRLTVGTAAEIFGSGVAVNALAPTGAVWTPGFVSGGVPKYSGRTGPTADDEPVEAMAEAALAICTSDPKSFSGKCLYSLRYLKEIGRAVMTLDGRKPLKA